MVLIVVARKILSPRMPKFHLLCRLRQNQSYHYGEIGGLSTAHGVHLCQKEINRIKWTRVNQNSEESWREISPVDKQVHRNFKLKLQENLGPFVIDSLQLEWCSSVCHFLKQNVVQLCTNKIMHLHLTVEFSCCHDHTKGCCSTGCWMHSNN